MAIHPENPNLQAIIDWHQKREAWDRSSGEERGSLPILRVVNGRLESVSKADMSLWNRFWCFFGIGRYAFENVSAVVLRTLAQVSGQERIETVTRHWENKVDRFLERHTFRSIEGIARRAFSEEDTAEALARSLEAREVPPMGELDSSDTLSSLSEGSRGHIEDCEKNLELLRQAEEDEETLNQEIERTRREKRAKEMVVEGYRILAQFFSGAKSRGEGHCLFRSFATALLQKGDFEELERKIRTAIEKYNILQGESDREESYQFVLGSFERLKEEASIPDEMNGDLSNAWVHLFRLLAAAPWRALIEEDVSNNKEKRDVLITFINSIGAAPEIDLDTDIHWQVWWDGVNREMVEAYLNDMENKNMFSWGGQPEIQGICKVLDISACILDVPQTGERNEVTHNVFPPDSTPNVYLFHEGQHYNPAFPKRPLNEIYEILGV